MNVNPMSRTCLHVPELSESECAAQLRPSSCMLSLALYVRQQQKSAAVSACISGLQVTLAN